MKDKKVKRVQQIPFRLHVNEHKQLKSKCALNGIKIQNVVEACVLAYLDGDEYVTKLISHHKEQSIVNKKTLTWSERESDKLLDELEAIDEGSS